MDSQDKTRVRKDNDTIENSIDPPVEDSATHICRCSNPGHINLLQWTKEEPSSFNYWDPLKSDSLDMEQIAREIKKAQETTQVVDAYCSSCRKFLEALPDILINQLPTEFDSIVRPHFQNMAEFGAALREKCRLCRLLDQAHTAKSPFKDGNINVYDFHKIENRLRCLGKPTAICMLIERVRYNDGIWISLNMPGVFEDEGFDLLGYLSVTPSELSVLKSTPAPESDRISVQLQIANQWLAECSTSHVHCCQNPTEFFPSRLIYVGGKFARLVVTSTLDHRPKYATLSHCWGEISYLMLKKTSIDSMMIKIPEDDLTKTFQDAIRISRALGIEYIWIDSLCIIQDSLSDWQAEAVLMQSVYSSSEINIAATGAADGSQGCFLQPQDYIAKVHVRDLKSLSDKSWDISNFPDWLDYMPLTRRAWALQERLLSTRTLHFSEREMIWECKTGDARENFPRIVERKREKTSLAHMWDSIVKQYTSTNLTNTRDKLIAIGGIARAAQLESGDRYLAGLWEKDIEVQLLWWSKASRSAKSDVYRAPSWSWASIDGTVHTAPPHLMLCKGHIHVHVMSVFVTPLVEESPFGEVRAGNLRMSCKALLSGNIHKAVNNSSSVHPNSNWTFNLSNGKEMLSRYELDLDSEIDEKKVVLLLVYDSDLANENQESRSMSLAGLVLQRSGVRNGEFLRVGMWSVRCYRAMEYRVETEAMKDGTYDNRVNSLLELFKTNETETAISDYAEILAEPKYPNERYIINIV